MWPWMKGARQQHTHHGPNCQAAPNGHGSECAACAQLTFACVKELPILLLLFKVQRSLLIPLCALRRPTSYELLVASGYPAVVSGALRMLRGKK